MSHIARSVAFTLLTVALVGILCGCQSLFETAITSANVDPANEVDPGVTLIGSNNAAPDFTLTDQFGQQVSLSQFRGKAVFLTFNDDECTGICPLTTQTLLEMLRLLGPAAQQIQLLAINVNQDHTAVQDVATFSQEHGMMNHWYFLTGSTSQLEAVWKAYHIEVSSVDGQVSHTPDDYLIDGHGDERELFMTSNFYSVVGSQADVWATQVAAVLPGHPTLATAPPLQSEGEVSPRQTVALPSLASDNASVDIGGASPHLLVFFASWAPDALTSMVDLNAYQNQATRNPDIPGIVAIDVGSVEPATLSAPAFMHDLAGKLSYPVVLDSSGAVADGYEVQDIPWLVLVKGGNIIWSHDGWLPPNDLLSQVHSAMK